MFSFSLCIIFFIISVLNYNTMALHFRAPFYIWLDWFIKTQRFRIYANTIKKIGKLLFMNIKSDKLAIIGQNTLTLALVHTLKPKSPLVNCFHFTSVGKQILLNKHSRDSHVFIGSNDFGQKTRAPPFRVIFRSTLYNSAFGILKWKNYWEWNVTFRCLELLSFMAQERSLFNIKKLWKDWRVISLAKTISRISLL